MKPMMKCGHAANATTTRDGETIPCCVICVMVPGLGDDGITVDDDPPDLSERRARCAYYGKPTSKKKWRSTNESNHGCRDKEVCDCEEPSDGGERWAKHGLAFFKHKPDRDFDEFYCGCHGWD